MTRGCLRAAFRRCGVQDLVRGYADGHLCECEELVPIGRPLLDGRPIDAADSGLQHPKQHQCAECGRFFALESVPLDGLPGVP